MNHVYPINQMMRTNMLFNHGNLIIDLIMNFIFVILAFIIFYKTKEMYKLTRYKGIKYFRYSFLFLGLAYFFRAFSLLIRYFFFINIAGKFSSFFLWTIPISFFGILSMLYLFLSLDWKRFINKDNEYLLYLFAFVFSIIFFVTRSHFILLILQSLILLLVIIFHILKNRKNVQKMFFLYSLLLIFWIFNLIIMLPKRIFPYFVFLAIQIFSLIIIMYILIKVLNWVDGR